jgi:hypothetical protein
MLCGLVLTSALLLGGTASAVPSGALGSLPVVDPTQPAPVPGEYQATYSTIENQLSSLTASAVSNPPANTVMTSALEVADGNALGPTVLHSNALAGSTKMIDQMMAMGETGVTIQVSFPLLVTSFPDSATYTTFYTEVAQVVHQEGMTLAIEENPLFPNISTLAVSGFYSSLTLSSYAADDQQMAQTIIDDMQPQYLSILGEPDTYTANFDNPAINLDVITNGVDFVNMVLDGLNRGSTLVGGGTGTWTSPSYDQALIDKTSINFLDMHTFMIAPVDLSNMQSEVAEAHAANLPIVMTECWLYKDTTNGYPGRGGSAAPDEQKLDTYAFWEPLDEQFVTDMVHYARINGFALLTPFNTEDFFAYQTWTATLDAESPTQVESSHDKLVTAAENAGTVSATGGAWETAITGSAPATGYDEVASDGGIFSFDAPFYGSEGGKPLDKPIVGMATTPGGAGYWEVASDGGLFAFGDAQFFGSMGGKPLDEPIVGIAATPDGAGYWEVASDGGLFAFGDAQFFGSMGGKPLDEPIVGIAATPDGAGYWEVASDGGIFAFGDARFYGSMGGKPLDEPIVGMATTPGGAGYWEVASDGGLFAFGDAQFFGSMGGKPLDKPIVAMAATPDGAGYWEVASDGGLFAFGDAQFLGSMGGKPLVAPIVGMANS